MSDSDEDCQFDGPGFAHGKIRIFADLSNTNVEGSEVIVCECFIGGKRWISPRIEVNGQETITFLNKNLRGLKIVDPLCRIVYSPTNNDKISVHKSFGNPIEIKNENERDVLIVCETTLGGIKEWRSEEFLVGAGKKISLSNMYMHDIKIVHSRLVGNAAPSDDGGF